MKEDKFVVSTYNIDSNEQLRVPQREGFIVIRQHFDVETNSREVAIVLPVGCGKSGLITLSPFAVKSRRTLVIAPGIRIKGQLFSDFDPTNPEMFYQKCHVIEHDFPEPSIITGNSTNISDLEESDVVITNIQQIQGDENFWLSSLPPDFFDLIIIDEAHHNVAESWQRVKKAFPNAKIINLSATPSRADGRQMEGEIIYSFPIFRAIELGYVKRLKAKVLNPSTLKYVRHEGGVEIEVSLDQIIQLGESDSVFRRSILSSETSLNTIVDCSIRELHHIRQITGDSKHKIIASALNFAHCAQITAAYQERGLRAAYIHSIEDSATNDRILEQLKNHELDVIVQVRMLGEGFDHPYLSVAAVCSVFSNLSPFAQFVGRIMRVVDQNNPRSVNNQGVVIFHAGGNIARRWTDFQVFSEADQDYFDQLLPLEEIEFINSNEYTLEPRQNSDRYFHITEQETISIEEIQLLDDQEARGAVQLLESKGYNVILRPIPVTKQRKRQAERRELDTIIKTKVGEILNRLSLNFEGHELDTNHIGRTNFITLKSKIDNKVNELVNKDSGQRSEFSQVELDLINKNLDRIIREIEIEIKNATS